MVLFLSVGRVSAEFDGTGQEAKGALPPVSLSCLSRQLEAFGLNPGFQCMSPKSGFPGFGTTTCIIKLTRRRPSPWDKSGRRAARLEI